MLALPFGLFVNEFDSAQRQHQIVQTYVPVEATVLTNGVEVIHGSKGAVHYVPQVTYQYEVDGKTYESHQVTPVYHSSGEEWANSIVAQFPVGQICKAYHDPKDPAKAILVRVHYFDPYFSMLEMAFCLTCGSFLLLNVAAQRKRAPKHMDNGWYAVAPSFGERARLRVAQICTLVWYGLGAVPALHYFLLLPTPHNPRSVHFFEGYALLGLIPLGLLVRYWWMNQTLDEATLLLNQPVAFLGKPLKFTISQPSLRQLSLKSVELRFVCIGLTRKGRSSEKTVLYESTPVESKNMSLQQGEPLHLAGELTPGADQKPTGRDDSGKFNLIYWEMQLDCEVAHAPDYHVIFPIEVQATAREETENRIYDKQTAAIVQKIDPTDAGRILTRFHVVAANLIGFALMIPFVCGGGLMAAVFPTVFPDGKMKPLWNLPKDQAQHVFIAGAVLMVVFAAYCLIFPSLLPSFYIRRISEKNIGRRRDAIVKPGSDAAWVDIIPRENWDRMMFENASDIGFVVVDTQRKEIRFEGDKERYRIPARAIQSCELVKSCLAKNASRKAIGSWIVLVRAYDGQKIWEAPFAPRFVSGRSNDKRKLVVAQSLQKQIQDIMPVPRGV